MAKFRINYNYNGAKQFDLEIEHEEELFDKVIDKFEQEGISIATFISIPLILKNLDTGIKYKLNRTGTDFEKI